MIFNPLGGKMMAKAKTKGDELVTAEIDLEDVIKAKKLLPVFRDLGPHEHLTYREGCS